MNTQTKKLRVILGLLLLIGLVAGIVWIVVSLWNWFTSLNSNLAVGMLTASTTVIVATITLVLGRYFERVKEAESHLRTQKIEIYDDFLKESFKLFYGKNDGTDLVPFLQEWQRKLVVWGGPNVLSSFVKWKSYLSSTEPNAQSVFLMDEFFREMRKDIGLSNTGLEKGFFSHMILRHANVFLDAAKLNPNITLAEVGKLEKKLGLE